MDRTRHWQRPARRPSLVQHIDTEACRHKSLTFFCNVGLPDALRAPNGKRGYRPTHIHVPNPAVENHQDRDRRKVQRYTTLAPRWLDFFRRFAVDRRLPEKIINSKRGATHDCHRQAEPLGVGKLAVPYPHGNRQRRGGESV